MIKTINVAYFEPGGVLGLDTICSLAALEDSTGTQAGHWFDLQIGASIGSIPSLLTKIPHPDIGNAFLLSANDMIDPFIGCAERLFYGKGSARHWAKLVAGRIAPQRRYDQTPLRNSITSQAGDRLISDLQGSHIVITHQARAKIYACFAKLDPSVFDTTHMVGLKNLGNNASLSDAVLASTAASMVFRSHQITGLGDFVDHAHAYSPADTIRDIFAMAAAASPDKDIRVRLVIFKIPNASGQEWCPRKHNEQGILANARDLIFGPPAASIEGSFAVLKRDFGNRLEIHEIATNRKDCEPPRGITHNDMFTGHRPSLEWRKETALAEARTSAESIRRTEIIDAIYATRAREEAKTPCLARPNMSPLRTAHQGATTARLAARQEPIVLEETHQTPQPSVWRLSRLRGGRPPAVSAN